MALKKGALRLEKTYFSYAFDSFSQFSLLFMTKSESLPLLFPQSLLQKRDRERFIPVAHDKRATLFHEGIALSLTKTRDLLKKPMSEFPTRIQTEY